MEKQPVNAKTQKGRGQQTDGQASSGLRFMCTQPITQKKKTGKTAASKQKYLTQIGVGFKQP